MKTQRKPTPVGHIFKEWMDNMEADYDQVRIELDMDPFVFEMFLDGVLPVSPYLCEKLAKVTGVSKGFWNNLQTKYEDYVVTAYKEDSRLVGDCEDKE